MLADEIAAALTGEGGDRGRAGREAGRTRAGRVVRPASPATAGSGATAARPPRWWLASDPGARRPARARPGASVPRPAGRLSRIVPVAGWKRSTPGRRRGGRGVVEAVTGTGKTRVGVAAALDELGRRGQVLVLVPTVELQHQWVAELRARLPAARRVGRMGAGAGDSLVTNDVLVAVVNSARALDVRPIRAGWPARRGRVPPLRERGQPAGPRRPVPAPARARAPPTPATTTATWPGWTRTSVAPASGSATAVRSPTGSSPASPSPWSGWRSCPRSRACYDELTEIDAGACGPG